MMQPAVKRALHKTLTIPFIYSAHATPYAKPPCKECELLNPSRGFAILGGNIARVATHQYGVEYLLGNRMHRLLCTEVEKPKEKTTEAVQELYQKIVKLLESKNFPSKTLRDSLLEKCKNTEDVKLAFEILEKLRIFKMANLGQHLNWPQQVTLAVASACVRANAPDIGLKTLWRHNIYGLTPDIGAAHSLLLYSKEKGNIPLMMKILQTMEKSLLKPQPRTADIILSICNDNQQWKLMSIYAKQFLKDGVKLHRDAYDTWISTAAELGNTTQVWKIQELRLASGFKYTVPSAFSCAKAYLLKWQPKEAAEVIFQLNQENLSESKKKEVYEELELLVDKWPGKVIARRPKDRRKALFSELKDCISLMFNCLLDMGFEVSLNVEERYCSKSSKAMAKLVS